MGHFKVTDEVKAVTDVTPDDFSAHPVWQYCVASNSDGVGLIPVLDLPVESLDERVVGTQVRLANGQLIWAVLFGLDSFSPVFNERDVGISFLVEGKRVMLGRAWERDLPGHGIGNLCAALKLLESDIFPITFDVSHLVFGDKSSLRGQFTLYRDGVSTSGAS